MTQSPLPPELPGLLAAEVLTKSPGAIKTYFVRLRFTAEQPPTGLLQALAAIGFASNSGDDTFYTGQIVLLDLVKPGTALFTAWTPAEADIATAALRDVLSAQGLRFAPRRATAGDLL